MKTVIDVFRPHIETAETWDLVHSEKFGWFMLVNTGHGEPPVFIADAHHLMVLLAETFFDVAPGKKAREIAANAWYKMEPYLAKLPPEYASDADIALGVLAKLDDRPV